MRYIAVMGHGVVGSGVMEVFEKNYESIRRRAGVDIEVRHILDHKDFPQLPYHEKFTKDFEKIIADPEVSIVVEVMGGLHPAFEYVKRCLEAGKSVVTSNKELVAAKGAELLRIAHRHNVNFLFEASVGGGIPIIRPLHLCLAANEIDEIAGILNGTTNFILTKMITEQMGFDEALALAQQLGYAERDPSADVQGDDACRKICILASLAYGRHIYPQEVHTEGITGLTLADVEYARAAGRVIKLIGRAKRLPDGKVEAMVSPAMIREDSQLAGVNDVFNAVLVRGNATGDVVFYGRGAGKLPTASAVVADVIEAAKEQGSLISLDWEDADGDTVVDYRKAQVAMYVRISAQDTTNGVAKVAELFGAVKYLELQNKAGEFAFIASGLTEEEMQQKLSVLSASGYAVLGRVRLLDY